MRSIALIVAAIAALATGACAQKTEQASAATPPIPQGGVPGSIAADRDGDGIIDGYYSADGIYHPNAVPAPVPATMPAVMTSRRGERG
jgi:hypothetical protein